MISNQEFYARLKKLFRRSLEVLLSRQDELAVQHEIEEQPEFLPGGGVRISTAMRQRFHLSQEDGRKLQELPEFRDLVSFVASSELAQDLLVDFGDKLLDACQHSGWLFQYLYLPLFGRYTHKAGGFGIPRKCF